MCASFCLCGAGFVLGGDDRHNLARAWWPNAKPGASWPPPKRRQPGKKTVVRQRMFGSADRLELIDGMRHAGKLRCADGPGPCAYDPCDESNADFRMAGPAYVAPMATTQGGAPAAPPVEGLGDPVRRRLALRRLLLDGTSLPQTLIIHLKRFSQSRRGRITKVSTHVAFDERLSVAEFCTRPKAARAVDAEYALLGVVVHMGRMSSGHYVAYVRGYGQKDAPPVDTNQWFYVSN